MSQGRLKTIFGVGAIVFAILAVVLFLIGILAVENFTFLTVMLCVIAVICLFLAVEFFLMLLAEKDSTPNFFLYNAHSGRNIPVQKLNFQIVNGRMNRYLSGYATSEGKLWTDRVLDNPYLEMEDHYKPAVAYKLLYDLAERDAEPGWKCFEIASDETVDFLCLALEANNDTDMARAIRAMKRAKPINMKQVRDYIVNNRQYLKSKLYRYVYDHIQLF